MRLPCVGRLHVLTATALLTASHIGPIIIRVMEGYLWAKENCSWTDPKQLVKDHSPLTGLLQEVIRMVDPSARNRERCSMSFFGGEEGDANESQGWGRYM